MTINKDDYKLNKDIPIPLYYQLKQIITDKINTGIFKIDECIPTEMDFNNCLGISRSTIRQALNELVSEGYLHREKGRGTFVSRPKIEEGFFQKLDSFNRDMLQKGLKPSTEVLELRVIAGIANINRNLKLHPDERLVHLCRLRYANGEPIVYLETYLPYKNHEELLKEDFTGKSLYSVLEEKYNKRIERAARKIEAVNANAHEVKLLNTNKNAAICLVKTTAFLSDGTPVEYSVAHYRGDRNQFTVELIR
jgi:GntR family transcriptional regulator